MSIVNQRIPPHDVALSVPPTHSPDVPRSKDAKRQVAFRFDADLLARIERYRAKLAGEVPGMEVTQANAVRVLLEKALGAEGFPARAATNRGR
jgi:hypothetical protein